MIEGPFTLSDFARAHLQRLADASWVRLKAPCDLPPTAAEIEALDRRGSRWETIPVDLPPSLIEAAAVLGDMVARVPEPYRETARLDLDSDCDDSAVEVSVVYQRPETDEEWAKRRADLMERIEYHRELRRKEFDKLKGESA